MPKPKPSKPRRGEKTLADICAPAVTWFDRRKNAPLRPKDVAAHSSRRVWWRCPKGPDHEWQSTAANMTKGNGCPFCSGKRVSITNRLSTVAPTVAQEWHPTKNGELTPADV